MNTLRLMAAVTALFAVTACKTSNPAPAAAAAEAATARYPTTTQHLKPGQITPVSGQYRNSITEKQCTSVKGEPLPPGPAGGTWSLTDESRHTQ